ncbi:MAG: NADP-dependent malic enzyme [Candidatus Woesearchaeota archaeon]
MDVYQESLKLHEAKKGKLEIKSKVKIKTKEDLSLAYTPGVAEPCKRIAANKDDVYKYTIKQNSVAVVTDGSAVLGLGNIGPEAALPVMEGKAILFKEFAKIDAYPICLTTQNVDEIVQTVKRISPGFGGINLEDISAPRCFEIEEKLQDIGIPVMHDDQHGTGVVLLAALMNAVKVVGKNIQDIKVVINGAGAAGWGIGRLLLCLEQEKNVCTPPKELIILDSKGAIYEGRKDLQGYKIEIAKITNKNKFAGNIKEALIEADAFIGVSKGNLLTAQDISKMNKDAIVFAMANPVPEIMPDEAKKFAKIVGTGRSDFPNQVNNVLAFPGIFRGALDARATKITPKMKIAAAHALAKAVENPTAEQILPNPLDKKVAKLVAKAVKKAAK